MLTFIIKLTLCVVIGFFPSGLLPVGTDGNGYPKEAGHPSFDDAPYIQIEGTGRETPDGARFMEK